MSRIRALIIDDEPLAHKVILEYVKDIPFLEIVGQCYLATEAYTFLSQSQVDLLFLDIQMPKLKGLDFLRTLDQKPQVILTTAYEEYALEGYELQVCDYLLKPFRFDRFLKAVNKAQQQINHSPVLTSAEEPRRPESGENIFVKVDKRFIQIALKDIQYIESYGNYIKIWTGESFHLTAQTLSGFADTLSFEQFLRVHKSFIVQSSFIDYVEGNLIKMGNGNRVPIGKSYQQQIKQWLKEG
jgi:DNA-binding LytR/AlgR family response regulator